VHCGPNPGENSPVNHWHLAGLPIRASAALLCAAGCMRARGWPRLQAGVPERHQFQGPEDVADFDNPPSPTAGQGTQTSDAAAEIACRGPRVSRPAGVVCPPR